MKCKKEFMRLYAVTDRSWTGEKSLCLQVEEALKGGVTAVQLREKSMSEEDFLREAREIRELCRSYSVPFFINDNVSIALACGADGVHVGQEDMAAGEVRRLVGENKILGVSVHNVEEARAAVMQGADYLGVGAMFATATKAEARPLSMETLREICESVEIPVVAIGGLKKGNIAELSGTGVDGVALVSAIFGAKDIAKECRELRQISESMVQA